MTAKHRFRVFVTVTQLVSYCMQRWPEKMERQPESGEHDPNLHLNKIAGFIAIASGVRLATVINGDQPEHQQEAIAQLIGMIYNGTPGLKNNADQIQSWLDGFNSNLWDLGFAKPANPKADCFIETDDEDLETTFNLVYDLVNYFEKR